MTKPRNTLTNIINDLDSGQDVNDLTGATIDLIISKHKDIERDILFPTVRGEIVSIRRLRVYAKEQNVYTEIKNGQWSAVRSSQGYSSSSSDSADPLDAFRQLRNETIEIPGFGLVRWFDCTIEQFQARKDYLTGKVRGLQKSIAVIQSAIDILVARGVRCLSDLDS